jgi:transcriptional activator for dhaKLM operon
MLPTSYPIQPENLESCWHAFIETGGAHTVDGFVPDPAVVQSWERCRGRLDPKSRPSPTSAKAGALRSTLKTHADLMTVAIPYVEDIHQFIEGSDCAILLADSTACILEVGGDRSAQARIRALGLGQGAYWAEGQLGTNALGLVLNTAMPVQVVGAEHYFRAFHDLVSTAAPVHDAHGRITGVLGIVGPVETATSHTLSLVMAAARAIGNQLQVNLYLEEASRRLTEVNAVLSAMHEGLIAWDAAGRIHHANPQAGELLHFSPAAVLGKPLTEVLQLPPAVADAIQQQTELRDLEVSFARNGQDVDALVSLRPIREGAGQPVGYIATLRPIEQVRQLVSQQLGAQASLSLQDVAGQSAAMRRLLRQATIAARGNAPVLLRGEGGVGKNVLGRAIHNASERANEPFIAINCRAIPHELAVAEFLGYDPSENDPGRPSKFELAHGGTLLLEQIESLSLEMQAALLHVMETQHLMRLRSTRLIPIDVRIIATTTANLEQLVAEGSFVRQLYYAFGVFDLFITALRERREDIPLLIERSLARMAQDRGRELDLDEEAMRVLCRYPWPGNVRELENVLERAVNHCPEGTIRVVDLPDVVRSGRVVHGSSPTPQPVMTLAEAEREAILRAGWAYQGRVTEMAEHLGIGRTTLWRKLKEFKVSPDEFK